MFTHDLKVARAYEHIATAKQLVEDWLATDAYVITREIDTETGHTVCKARIETEPPLQIGLAVGDAVHNLRSALDHAIYEIAETHHGGPLPATDQESLMFPIVGNQNRKGQKSDGAKIFQDSVVRLRLDDLLPDNALRYIESIQPYHWHGDDFRHHWLWRVHDLDRIDKHRRIHVTTGWLEPPWVSVAGDPRDHEIVFHHGGEAPVHDGASLITFSGADAGVEPHLLRAVGIYEPTIGGQEVGRLLDVLAGRVDVYVASLTGEILGPVWR